MKFSIVTISYNQVNYLETAIRSVLCQTGVDVEYIIVDPGSTDGSRDIIDRYQSAFRRIILEPDSGPPNGLNKGFSYASGDIYGYLNSDDAYTEGCLANVLAFMEANPDVDIVSGHGLVIDGSGETVRRIWSDRFSRVPVAYGASVQVQPSTFIRRTAFKSVGGFNEANLSNWDGELLVDIYLKGFAIATANLFLSAYRVHTSSITGSGSHHLLIDQWDRRRFEKLMGREFRSVDRLVARSLKLYKHLRYPNRTLERLINGPIYLRASK